MACQSIKGQTRRSAFTEAGTEETLAPAEYEEMMADSDEKHAADSKPLADKGALKADTEDELVKEQDGHKTTAKELMAMQDDSGSFLPSVLSATGSSKIISLLTCAMCYRCGHPVFYYAFEVDLSIYCGPVFC